MQENSITLTAEQQDAYRLDAELKQHANTVVGEMIEIGRCLKEISERKLYLLLDAGTFAEYAEKAVGLKERAAYNYIKAYETYGADGLKKYGEIGITKLVSLAQLNDTDRTELLESGEAAELSSRKLDERIKELKGENDQLRFELDDAETTAKNNATKIATMQKEIAERREEAASLKQQLEEAQRPVVASMTDEEKEEIRREAEKKAKAEADKTIKTMKKEHDQSLKTLRNNIDAANNATSERDKTISEQKGKIHKLEQELDAARAVNAELQARAAKEKKPVIAGSKEALKFCLEDIQEKAGRAVEIISGMEQADKEKFKAGLIVIVGKLREAAEGIE